ncbi:hypothetical protein [Aminipila terrae]|uniref:Uncharacterized protein n=1 Tax=Aminipila terrae TaxID=2697030 RepID=A0A6P1MKD2_9FIRM|nr:hypothetical protein [Aminipila terrae]QHI73613.1 hypothetical protein Ami3637_15630 [Aminipila terrae]
MNHKFPYYLINKIFSIVIFIIFYLFVVYLQEKINEYLPFGMWGLNTIGLIINLTFGVIIGWFLLDDIKLKLNKHQNIATICILIFLSLYQYFFYAPILNKYLSFELFYAVKYPQLILGAYLVLYLKKFFKEKT